MESPFPIFPAMPTLLCPRELALVGFRAPEEGEVQVPISLDPGLDVSRTVFLSRLIQRWGKLPLMLLQECRLEESSLRPDRLRRLVDVSVVPPSSLVVIDDTRRRIANSGWTTEFERPIYFLEHREGYACRMVRPSATAGSSSSRIPPRFATPSLTIILPKLKSSDRSRR